MTEPIDFSQLIPIFPLPNGVLMPGAILPIHIFEQRYREMTRDALARSRLVASALLKPGFQARYDTLDVEIFPEVCVGRIVREELLADGCYNLLLQGVSRARVLRENLEFSYRRGRLESISAVYPREEVECAIRQKLHRQLCSSSLVDFASAANWLELLKCPGLSLSDMVDALASAVLPCVEEKQHFLAEPRVDARAAYLCNVLTRIGASLKHQNDLTHRARSWPPQYCNN